MSTLTRPSRGRRARAAVHPSHAQGRARGQVLVEHVADEAAGAVAALLDLVAVGAVEDAVGEVHAGRSRRLDDQDLVGADAEAPIAAAAAAVRASER
jgi:hypothetical protein